MFRGFRLPLSAAGACAEDLQKSRRRKNIEENAKPQVPNRHLGHLAYLRNLASNAVWKSGLRCCYHSSIAIFSRLRLET
jgi:hypothetical protein